MVRERRGGLEPRVEKRLLIFPLDILLLLSLVLDLVRALIDRIIEARIIHCGRLSVRD